jgi:CAAX protease family protein
MASCQLSIGASCPGGPVYTDGIVLHPLTRVFWNPGEHRLRAFLRLVLFVVLVLLLEFGAATLIIRAYGPEAIQADFNVLTILLGGVVPITLAVFIAVRLLDRRPARELGIVPETGFWTDLGFGLLLGAGVQTLIFLVEYEAGWLVVTGFRYTETPVGSFTVGFGGVTIVFVAVGFYEELLSRAYLLRNIAQGLAGRLLSPAGALLAATAVSSAIFGALHLPNPNASLVSTFNIALAGVALALPYILTGRLAGSVGLHITWNLFQGAVYGFPVSGMGIPVTAIAIRQTGPVVWTGGAFGPEGGLIGLLAFVLIGVLIVLRERVKKGRVSLETALAVPRPGVPETSAGPISVVSSPEP